MQERPPVRVGRVVRTDPVSRAVQEEDLGGPGTQETLVHGRVVRRIKAGEPQRGTPLTEGVVVGSGGLVAVGDQPGGTAGPVFGWPEASTRKMWVTRLKGKV